MYWHALVCGCPQPQIKINLKLKLKTKALRRNHSRADGGVGCFAVMKSSRHPRRNHPMQIVLSKWEHGTESSLATALSSRLLIPCTTRTVEYMRQMRSNNRSSMVGPRPSAMPSSMEAVRTSAWARSPHGRYQRMRSNH